MMLYSAQVSVMHICFAIIMFVFSAFTVYAAPSEAHLLCCPEIEYELSISTETPACCEAATGVGCCSPMTIHETIAINCATENMFCVEYRAFIPITPKNSIFKPPEM